jgi:pSer/pThr/pTyr-binding forkhead associated (FHA) protein
MKLKVLAGAKDGTEIPLKRSKFLIGRSSECTLRAGSDAISRRHCVLLTTDTGLSVRDLGSRNGTLVNGVKITTETPLKPGDQLAVGPLKFEVIASSADVAQGKKPKVKSVAEAVDRTASRAEEGLIGSDLGDSDISNWLLGPSPAPSASTRETMSFRVDETHATKLPAIDPSEEVVEEEAAAEEAEAPAKEKKKGKKQFGKLPTVPKKPGTKDSREAATDILREMSRRR